MLGDEAITEAKRRAGLSLWIVHYDLGLVYDRKGWTDEAITEYKLAIELDPKFADAHFNLAYAYYLSKRFDLAWRYMRIAEKLGMPAQKVNQLIDELRKVSKEPSEEILPCKKTDDCPYEYDKGPGRDIEGMPFIENDPRSCPKYGHLCPEFMEDLGLTVEDLNIRAIIHCGRLMDHLVNEGKADRNSPEYKAVMEKYEEIVKKYPNDKYPQYY